MNFSSAAKSLRYACALATALFGLASISWAQGQGVGSQTQMGTMGGGMTDQLVYGTMGHEVEREQDAAYKAFMKEPDAAKKIQLGSGFLQKWPKAPLAESVDIGLMKAYHARQDWKNTYLFADNALALNPDDVDALTTVSWTIPHVYSPNDPDADQELDKAETYAKHALEVLAKMPKPPELTDAQFADSKAKRLFQAHSALGLVYFRRDDFDNSAKELYQSTKGNPGADQTDLYVLGVDLQNLKRDGEAAEAFSGCSQIAGALQDRCKQIAGEAKNVAPVSK